MDIPSSSSTLSPPTATSAPAAVSTATQIGSDFEMFLQMLTAQMQYQDPLNPIDSTDYATQLATFSGVEQAVQTNDLLRALTAQFGGGSLVNMAALVGKEARSAGPALFDGQPITLYPQMPPITENAEIIVRDRNGSEVQRIAMPSGAETVTWAGVAPDGTPMQQGTYQFELAINHQDGTATTHPVEAYGKVIEVRRDTDATMLILEGGIAVQSGAITALRD